jgi:hypothetical protein
MTGVVSLSPEEAAALPGPAVSLPTMGTPPPPASEPNVVEITRANVAPAAPAPAPMPQPEAPTFGAEVEARFEQRWMARTMGVLPSAPKPQQEQQQQQEPAQPDTFLGRLGAMLPTPDQVAQRPPRASIVGGAMRDTAQGVIDLPTELGQWAGLVDRGVKIKLGDVRPGEAQTRAGQAANAGHEIARGLAAFAMPFGAAAKVLRGMGMGRYVTTMMAGGLADMLQDPTQGNLSTLARDLGVEGDVLTFLDSRVEEDAPAEERLRARLKQVIEGAGAGLVIDGLIGLATADRAARRAGAAAPAPAPAATPSAPAPAPAATPSAPAPEPSAMDRQHAATRPAEAPTPAPRRGDAGPPLTPEQRAYRAQQRAKQAKEKRESFRTVIAGEEPITAGRLAELVEGLTGRRVLGEMRTGYDGSVDFPIGTGRVPLAQMQVRVADIENATVLAHETGHVIHLAELGPNPRLPAAVRAELEASDDIAGATASYAPGKQEEELFATSVQMLLIEPDYFKAMHPTTDAWLRRLVNDSPRLQDYIVLRLVPLALASAAGAAGASE